MKSKYFINITLASLVLSLIQTTWAGRCPVRYDGTSVLTNHPTCSSSAEVVNPLQDTQFDCFVQGVDGSGNELQATLKGISAFRKNGGHIFVVEAEFLLKDGSTEKLVAPTYSELDLDDASTYTKDLKTISEELVGYVAYDNPANDLLCFFAAQTVSGEDIIWQRPTGDNFGCIPAGNPPAFPFRGPPIGFSATPKASGYTGFQFIFDDCWCSRSQINPFTFPSETVTTEGLTPTIPVTWATKKHALQDLWLLATDCPIELRVEDGGENLFSIDQATSELTLNSGVAPGTYTFSVVAYLKDYPDASDMSYASATSTI